jgi:hypothetical protein
VQEDQVLPLQVHLHQFLLFSTTEKACVHLSGNTHFFVKSQEWFHKHRCLYSENQSVRPVVPVVAADDIKMFFFG